jgi:aspartate racemase
MTIPAPTSVSPDFASTLSKATNSQGVVGVLGGMGPLATVDFLHKMLLATAAEHDQDHVPVLACNMPQIPDRTLAYRGQGPSPLPAMLGCAERLVAGGAGLIVVPCNTAHLWFDDLQRQVPLPMLHIVDAALAEVTRLTASAQAPVRVGLLATDATLSSGLYMNRRVASSETGCEPFLWSLPTAVEMMEHVMPLNPGTWTKAVSTFKQPPRPWYNGARTYWSWPAPKFHWCSLKAW